MWWREWSDERNEKKRKKKKWCEKKRGVEKRSKPVNGSETEKTHHIISYHIRKYFG